MQEALTCEGDVQGVGKGRVGRSPEDGSSWVQQFFSAWCAAATPSASF